MQRGSGQEVNNLQEGAAVGVWIIRKSKTYPGHNYYFNTLTGAAVWNLSEQEIANAMRMPNINRFDNHAEPREKPPMMNFNPASEFNHPIINKKYPSEASPISTSMCPQSAIHNSQGSINSVNMMTTQLKSNPNIWDLGLRQQIVILPTVTPLNQPQTISYGYNLHQRNNLQQWNSLQQRNDLQQKNGLSQRNVWQQNNDFQQRNDLQNGSDLQPTNGLQSTNGLQPTNGLQQINYFQQINDLQQRNDLEQRNDLQKINDLQQRNDLQQIHYLQQRNDLQQINDLQQQNDLQYSNNLQQRNNMSACRHIFKNIGKVNRSGINRGKTFLNRYHKTWSKQDLRKKISKHVNYNKNYLNTSRLPFSEGFINDTKFTQAGTIEDEENYETMSLIENEEDSVSKLDCTPLKNLGKPSVHKSCWYLLVDTNVLIHNFNYLNNLTSTDPTCCFLVPHCVFDELTSYAEKEQDATAGRVLRFLFDFAYIGIEELEIESEYESTTDVLRKIYNVYVNIEKDNYHAVLISDDKNLLKYKGVIHVFSMAEVKNMVSVYVSHQTSAPSSSISDRVVIINKNHDFHTTMDSNHTASNGKRSFSESQKEDNLRKVSLPSKSIKTHICTELMKKKCQLKSFNDISITIVNTDNRINTIESADEVSIEQNCFNDTTKTSTLIEECTPRMVEKKNVIRLNRNKLPPYNNNTTETPIVGTGKKKFRWRKRRNNFRISGSEDNIVSSIDDNERRVENTGSLECEKETSENTSKNPSKEKKSKDLDTNESSNSCIAFKNSSSNSESLDRRKDIIENEVANSDNKNQLKDLECDESSNSCTFVKKFIGDCIVIDDSSTSEIISNSESNVNSTHVLNIQKTPKLFRRFKNSNKNLLNNIMFTVTSKAMEENIKMKCDEWVSRFVQIMEDVLAQILRQESVIERIALPPPWSLQEAVQCIIKEFYSHCFVVDSANKLSIISKEIENTKSITNIHPEDFMEMYSYGVNLVDALKDVQPNEDLNIASKSLSDLLHDIEFGQNDSFVDEVVPEDKGETTLIPDIPLKDIVHSVSGIKVQNNENPEKCASPSSKTTSVVRNSSPAKKIKEDVMVTFIAKLSESNTADAEIDHRVTNTRRLTQETNNSNEVNGLIENNKHDSIIEPKIVRCFTKFPQFEERINNSYRTLMDIYSTDSDIFYEEDNYEATNCSMGDEDITNLYETPNTRTYFANVQKNKIQVDLFLKKFLIYVKNVLTRAREFCKRCVIYLNKQGSAIADMRLQVNTEKVHSEVISIYYNLSSILSRGNGDENINYLLKKSGCECEEFSEQYWNTIKKCREQASAVLKIVEHITMALKR